jgi:hypothetical protein
MCSMLFLVMVRHLSLDMVMGYVSSVVGNCKQDIHLIGKTVCEKDTLKTEIKIRGSC